MITLTRVKQATSEFIKVLRLGKNDVQTPSPVLPYGIDSKPIKELIAVHAKTMQKGDSVILGYLAVNYEKTLEGESRIFATDDDGVEKFEIHLKKDGTCKIGGDADNIMRFSPTKTGFDTFVQDFNNFIDIFNTHVHISAAPGVANAPTATPGTPSTAEIDGSKIEEITTL